MRLLANVSSAVETYIDKTNALIGATTVSELGVTFSDIRCFIGLWHETDIGNDKISDGRFRYWLPHAWLSLSISMHFSFSIAYSSNMSNGS